MRLCANNTTSSNRQDDERKVTALKKARAIWNKTAHRSNEAAHATKVLDQILLQVSLQNSSISATRSPRSSEGERFAASAGACTASSASARDATKSTASQVGEASLRAPTWSAVNSAASSKPPSKSYSVEWSSDWLGSLGQANDQAADDPFASVSQGADWVSSPVFFFSFPLVAASTAVS